MHQGQLTKSYCRYRFIGRFVQSVQPTTQQELDDMDTNCVRRHKHERSKIDDAMVLVHRMRRPEGCDEIWLISLIKYLESGVDPVLLGTSITEVRQRLVDIYFEHAVQWFTLIREEMNHHQDVTGMITNMKKWLVKGQIPYSKLQATPEEISLFDKISPELHVET
jgi:hypothetical protein